MVREYENPIVGQCNVEDLQRAAFYKEKVSLFLFCIKNNKQPKDAKHDSQVNNCHMFTLY